MGAGALYFVAMWPMGTEALVFRGNVGRSRCIPRQWGPGPLYSVTTGARALVIHCNGGQGPCNSLQLGPGAALSRNERRTPAKTGFGGRKKHVIVFRNVLS